MKLPRSAYCFSVLLFPGLSLSCFLGLFLGASVAQAKFKYHRLGNSANSHATPQPGLALMGGGSKLDDAFRFLCVRAGGGDFLVLSANDDDAYLEKENTFIKSFCPLNSAATLSFSSRDDSTDPKVQELIANAGSIFIAGGDQSDYVRFWQDTPVQAALNRHIAAGKPIGGSSAGLAILGEFSFSAMIDTIHSPEALGDPYGNKVTLAREFLDIPILRGTITDTHFVKRDRMGRLLVFMARILQDGWASEIRAIAVEENAAVLVEADGSATVIGGPAYFLRATRPAQVCGHRRQLTFSGVSVVKVGSGKSFSVSSWKGSGDAYELNVAQGVISSSSSDHQPY